MNEYKNIDKLLKCLKSNKNNVHLVEKIEEYLENFLFEYEHTKKELETIKELNKRGYYGLK